MAKAYETDPTKNCQIDSLKKLPGSLRDAPGDACLRHCVSTNEFSNLIFG